MPVPDIRFKPSTKLYGYLRLLARDTMLGSTVNDVAEKLLTIEAERRFLDGYHDRRVPIIEEDGSAEG